VTDPFIRVTIPAVFHNHLSPPQRYATDITTLYVHTTSVLNWVSLLQRKLGRLKIKEINFKNLKNFKITGNDALVEAPDVNTNLISLRYYAELDLNRHETICAM